MIDLASLLSTLRERNVRLWVEQDGLKCSAPVGVLDAEMRATLTTRKGEILTYLRQAETGKCGPAAIVPIKPGGNRPPIFVVSGHGGDVFRFVTLARHLDPEQPLLGVQPPGLDGSEPLTSVESLARYEVEQICRYQPDGPYLIAGHCAGGTIAFEVAHQLAAMDKEVVLLALIGSPFPTMFGRVSQTVLRFGSHARALASGSLADRRWYVMDKVRQRQAQRKALAGVRPTVLAARQRVESATLAAVRSYRPQHYRGQIDLFVTSDAWHRSHQWRAFAPTVREHCLEDISIDDLLMEPHVMVLAALLQDTLKLD